MSDTFDLETEQARLDGYAAANRADIMTVAQSLKDRGVEPSALDELVHEAAENVSEDASDWASSLNNDGLESQVAFLLQENGMTEGREMIETAASEWLAENAARP